MPSCQDKDTMRKKKSLETNIPYEYSAKYPEHRKIDSTIYHIKEVISKKAHDNPIDTDKSIWQNSTTFYDGNTQQSRNSRDLPGPDKMC